MQADFYVANTGAKSQYRVTCTKRAQGGYLWSQGPGPATPNYVKPANYPNVSG